MIDLLGRGDNQWPSPSSDNALEIIMSGEKVLTKQIAEQFLADVDSVGLSEFTASEDDVAKSLSNHKEALSRRPDQPFG